jgi:acetyltransferase-like isoleucine patch superfamily enzyme
MQRGRGVRIGRDVFIGDSVFFDGEFPEQISIADRAQISIRAILIAHTRGPGRIIIEKEAFIGPNVVLIAGAGRTLRIGEGAVIGAGCVITRSVPRRTYIVSAPVSAVARVEVPLSVAKTMEEFWGGLRPLPGAAPAVEPAART